MSTGAGGYEAGIATADTTNCPAGSPNRRYSPRSSVSVVATRAEADAGRQHGSADRRPPSSSASDRRDRRRHGLRSRPPLASGCRCRRRRRPSAMSTRIGRPVPRAPKTRRGIAGLRGRHDVLTGRHRESAQIVRRRRSAPRTTRVSSLRATRALRSGSPVSAASTRPRIVPVRADAGESSRGGGGVGGGWPQCNRAEEDAEHDGAATRPMMIFRSSSRVGTRSGAGRPSADRPEAADSRS